MKTVRVKDRQLGWIRKAVLVALVIGGVVDGHVAFAREKHKETLTAQDQGETKSDLVTTKRIRRELIRLDKLSSEGKNVTVITRRGVVTLKGEVASDTEKDRILKTSARIVGARNVRSELTVNPTTNQQ